MSVEVNVRRDLTIDGEPFKLLVETHHGSVIARTAVHRQDFARRIGGARFVRNGDVAEVGHLAAGMTWKCAAAGLPADGQKSVIACPQGIPESFEERAAILADHVEAAKAVDPGVIFGPDMNNPEGVMDLLAARDDLRDHVTGLSGAQGGLSIDTRGYTAHGVVAGIRAALRMGADACTRASIQGFGAVGGHSAVLLQQAGIDVNAASVVCGALIADAEGRLDVRTLLAQWEQHGDQAFASLALSPPPGTRFDPDPDALLEVPTDIFLPAARTAVLAMPDELDAVRMIENPDCQDVVAFLEATGVSMIAQGANHPLTNAAERYLEEHDVTVLPDYIVNSGGLVGCFVEWAYRSDLRGNAARQEELHEETLQVVAKTVEHNVHGLASAIAGARAGGRAIAEARRSELLARRSRFPGDADGHALADSCLQDLLVG